MNKKSFFTLIILAFAFKWIFDSILISLLFAFILGSKKDDSYDVLKGAVLAFGMGIVTTVSMTLFGAQEGFSIFLNIFRSLGIQLNTTFAYSTIHFIFFAYIFVIEFIAVFIGMKAGSKVQEFFERRGIKLLW